MCGLLPVSAESVNQSTQSGLASRASLKRDQDAQAIPIGATSRDFHNNHRFSNRDARGQASALCSKAQLLRHILAEGRAITVDSALGFKRGV